MSVRLPLFSIFFGAVFLSTSLVVHHTTVTSPFLRQLRLWKRSVNSLSNAEAFDIRRFEQKNVHLDSHRLCFGLTFSLNLFLALLW